MAPSSHDVVPWECAYESARGWSDAGKARAQEAAEATTKETKERIVADIAFLNAELIDM